jgi:hypothetical protein
MLARKRFAVDVVGEEVCGIVEAGDRMTGCVAFGGVKDGVLCGGENFGAIDDWLQ